MRAFQLSITALILLSALVFADTKTDSIPSFGNPLFAPSYPMSVYDGGQLSLLNPVRLSTLNVKQVSDLIKYDIRFFQLDLVTDGQEIGISMLGSGERQIKAVWKGRPLRDPRTGNPDLNRLSPLWIGGLRTVHSGAIAGVSGSQGIIDLLPVEVIELEPQTVLHHREGFYRYQPVEFVHTRRLSPSTDLFTGGYFPASSGRFGNAVHDGSNLFAEIRKYLPNDKVLSVGHQTRRDKVGIAFTDSSRLIKDNDFDISLSQNNPNGMSRQIFGYHLERAEREGKFRAHGRDWGVGIRAEVDSIGFYGRIGRIDIDMPSTEKIRIIDVESSVSYIRVLRGFRLWGLIGVGGYLPDRTGLNAAFSVDKDINKIGKFGIITSRNSDPLTPEILYADYTTARPTKLFNTVWVARPDLPISGKILPVSTTDNIELYWSKSWQEYMGKVSVFQKFTINPVIWSINDNTIVPYTSSNHRTRGWLAEIGWTLKPYRANLSIVSLYRDEVTEIGVPSVMGEPSFRLSAESGWHRMFMNGRFEADISFSGNYINSYFTKVADGWSEMGGAYPLHFKMSGRIRSFTLYYGVHNWNSYQYYTVPGYRMMHKEEHFGIFWQIMN